VAPHLIHLWQRREVMLKVMALDNSPEYLVSLSRYVDDQEFLKSIIPLMRCDFKLMTSYRFSPSPPLDCPITAFAACQDDMVYTDEIREWDRHTRGGFELIEVDGDHWFLNRNRDLLNATFREIAGRGALIWDKHEPTGVKLGPHSATTSCEPVTGTEKVRDGNRRSQ
jgi:surfactin synthase thioesterase subunit